MSGRRGFIAGAAGIAAALIGEGAVAGASEHHPEADLDLLAACQRFASQQAELDAYIAYNEDDDDRMNAINERWWEELEVITGLPAQTVAGLKAKAGAARIALRVLACSFTWQSVPEDGNGQDRLAWSLIHDIIERPWADVPGRAA